MQQNLANFMTAQIIQLEIVFTAKFVVWVDVLSTFALNTQDLKVACWLERNIIFADSQLHALNASQKQRKKV